MFTDEIISRKGLDPEDILINDDSSFYMTWNIIILFVMILNIIFFPFEIFSEQWLDTNI